MIKVECTNDKVLAIGAKDKKVNDIVSKLKKIVYWDKMLSNAIIERKIYVE